MIYLTINGQSLEVPEGTTVLQAAERIGITLPTLCYHRDLSPFGGCRLCVVEVQGARLPMTSCNLPVSPEMTVVTDSPNLTRFRRAVLRMLLTNFYDSGYKNSNGKAEIDQESELAYWARVYDVDIRSNMAKRPSLPIDQDPNPFVWVDMNKCIQCTRCVRACAEIQGRFVWSQAYRGYQARIVAGADTTMLQARCESCGACVAYCPTGALDNKMSIRSGQPDWLTTTTCTYCSVGCQLDLNIKDDTAGGRVIRVTSHQDSNEKSVNGLHLCVKGRYGYEFIHDSRRLTRPRVREYLLDGIQRPANRGKWVDVDWEIALDLAAKGLNQCFAESSGESIGVLTSGRLTNEENYLVNKLARQILGTNHIDCNAHLYHGTLIRGLMEAAGLPAMSRNFEDLTSHSRSALVLGSNLTEQHPVFGAQLRQAILKRKIKLVVATPDFINLVEYAALPLYHLPKTEVALLNGLMYLIIENGKQDKKAEKRAPQEFIVLKESLSKYTPDTTAGITGVSPAVLKQAADILSENRPGAVLWGAGSIGLDNSPAIVQSLVNLQILLGNLELPGGGLFPLRSQSNLQGACDMGATPDYLPSYQPINERAARQRFEAAWGATLPSQAGLNASELMHAANQGTIKALYILGEDLLNTTIAATRVRQALEKIDLVVLQTIQPGETSRYADILLPGVSFAEKDGTYTSAERRIQLIRKAIAPVGQSRPDWQVIAELAKRLLGLRAYTISDGPYAYWDYETVDQIMEEIAAITPIYQGVSHTRLELEGGIHWPVETDTDPGHWFLRHDYFKRWEPKWIPTDYIPSASEQFILSGLTI